jgi:hypothetical protein
MCKADALCRLDNYRDTNIMFMGIENIHSMRDSVRKLFDLIKNEVRGNERANWWSCLEVRAAAGTTRTSYCFVDERSTDIYLHANRARGGLSTCAPSSCLRRSACRSSLTKTRAW